MGEVVGKLIGKLVGRPAPDEPRVLELRVHGVNNTTPAALADLPAYDLRQVAGDERAGFWLAQPDLKPAPGTHGYIPPGIRREAYSWGGLVRRDAGKAGWWTAVAASFQVLVLPFSVGNAAMWTRRLTTDAATGPELVWSRMTAGAARLFGLVLTLLFTTTAVTVAVDVLALQCAGADVCGGLWTPAWDWVTGIVPAGVRSPARVLAAATLVPVLAVLVLAGFARRSRKQYDTLLARPGAIGHSARQAAATSAMTKDPAAAATDAPVLRQRTLWTNQITGRLSLVHVAAALALITVQVSGHAGFDDAADASTGVFRVVAWVGLAVLVAAVVVVAFLPTQTITPLGPAGGTVVGWAAWTSVVAAGALLATTVVSLVVIDPPGSPTPGLLSSWSSSAWSFVAGADVVPVYVISIGALLALSGLWWRQGHRDGTAWHGNGPAVFMTLSLCLAVLTSASVLSLLSLLLVGGDHPVFVELGFTFTDDLRLPVVFPAVGGLIAWGLLLFAVVAFIASRRKRSLAGRATMWKAPTNESLTAMVQRRRATAAFVHAMEPAVGLLALTGGIAIAVGVIFTWASSFLPPATSGGGVIALTTWIITGVGILLAAAVAYFGVFRSKPSFIAIVWDITCFLPRTAQPFGPPCYAERAVPDIAQRLHDWLDGHPDNRAVLAAHSMGGMVAVAGLALLATSFPDDLKRVSLLTFGVQLRTFFGRFLPELVGPGVLGTYPSRGPRWWPKDPWNDDVTFATRAWPDAPEPGSPIDRMKGRLLPGTGVRWISLWRLTDYLGFPAVAGTPEIVRGTDSWPNLVDRYADEVDVAADPAVVVTHNDYIRVATYEKALLELAAPPSG